MMANTSTNTFIYLLRGGISETTLSPEQMQKQIEKYMRYIQGLRDKGHFIAGEPLEETGKILSGERGRKVTDGPFTESKEAVGGYFLIRAKDFSEAVELSRDCPIFANGGKIEVRPIQKFPVCSSCQREALSKAPFLLENAAAAKLRKFSRAGRRSLIS